MLAVYKYNGHIPTYLLQLITFVEIFLETGY